MKLLRTKNHLGLGPKNLLIICGVHGNETFAIRLVMELYSKLKKEETNQTDASLDKTNQIDSSLIKNFKGINDVTFLIGVNETGIAYGQREFYEENTKGNNDLNRVFIEPNKSKQEIIDTIQSSIVTNDIVIDVHNSEMCDDCVILGSDPYCEKNLATFFKSYFDLNTEKKISSLIWNSNRGTIREFTNSLEEKFGFTLEFSSLGIVPNSILKEKTEKLAEIVKYIIEAIALYQGEKNSLSFKEYSNITTLTSKPAKLKVEIKNNYEGIVEWTNFENYNDVFRFVKQNEVVAYIKNYKNEIIEEIKAPYSGKIIDICPSYYACANGVIGDISPNIEN
jgi:succinylglutamate desuccinylase